MENSSFSLLLVEDDQNLSLVLADFLQMLGYNITLCHDGEEGLLEFKKKPFHLCIFDVMLPKKDGFSLATDVRKINSDIPIIFLTAKSLKADRIKGFTIGCDDYITKPFSTEELRLRIKAILKRCNFRSPVPGQGLDGTYKIGKFTLDYVNMILKSEESEKHLTRKESALLKLLFEYKNQILPREVALNSIWGGNDYFIGRSMDVFITKLRKYLKSDPTIVISNIHGTGFKLEIQQSDVLIA